MPWLLLEGSRGEMRGILPADAHISTVDAARPTAVRRQTAKALCSSQKKDGETEGQEETEDRMDRAAREERERAGRGRG